MDRNNTRKLANCYSTMINSSSIDHSEIRSVCKSCSELVHRFLSSEDIEETRQSTQNQIKLSINIINDALNRHGIEEIALSFNGGKDCLVMLVLFLATLHDRADSEEIFEKLDKIPSVYVHVENSFKEVDDFVEDCRTHYHLDIIRLAPPLKNGFEKYLAKKPHIKAILVGIRRTDPYGENLTYYERTDHGWPDFMRVHPVLEWHYVQIWDFLRFLNIPYCPLYDLGYTSLGGTKNTCKNPSLMSTDSEGHKSYKPAYELVDDDLERLSRMT